MKRLAGLQQRFGFTENEVRVILFLGLSLLAGTVIRWLRSPEGPSAEEGRLFNYASADSEFAARSRILPPEEFRKGSATKSRRASPRTPALAPGSIDINSASREQLLLLPGIGEAFAGRIILYRDQHGPFASVDALRAVRGIGPATLAKIRPFVTAGPRH